MTRILLIFMLLAVSVPVYPASSMVMWGCAPMGERRNVLYLVDRGTRSYVKIGSQRADARLTTENDNQRWTWGANSIVLTPEAVANYYEDKTAKGKFKCKRINSR